MLRVSGRRPIEQRQRLGEPAGLGEAQGGQVQIGRRAQDRLLCFHDRSGGGGVVAHFVEQRGPLFPPGPWPAGIGKAVAGQFVEPQRFAGLIRVFGRCLRQQEQHFADASPEPVLLGGRQVGH